MKHETPIVPAGCEHYRSQVDMPQELNDRLRRCAQEFGETYAAYLVTEQDREYFWCSERRGVVGFRRLGRYLYANDGLLAAPADRELLLREFLAFAEQNRWHPTFLNVPRNEIHMFRRHQCQVTKCGEEPLVRLQRTDWQGKESQWLRRQENFCKRQGVEICEINPDPADAVYQQEVAPQLEEISRAHLALTLHGKELRFFVSQFSARQLSGKRLFVARIDSHIMAFIVCNPGLAGDLWAVEVYRRRPDAVRGAIPCIIMHAMRAMKAEGARYFSLSLAPFLRCTPMMGDSVIFRSVANLWWRLLNPIYNVRGLFHFKSRFRPDYREMYLAAKPRVTIRSLFAIALVWKLFHFNPFRLGQRVWRQKKRAEQGNLALSEARPDRMIRDLRHYPAGRISRAARMPPIVVEEKQFGEPSPKRRSPFEASLWLGMDFFAWARLLGRNRFAIDFSKAPLVLVITMVAAGNTVLRWIQTLWFGRRVRAVPAPDDPIFIIGHWRTGTTMLHELMSLDPRNRCPTTYESLSPNHFLLSESVVRRFFGFVLPRKRPFDNMRMGFEKPQEDEAALCLRGQPSPFLTVAFPGRSAMYPDYIDLETLSPPKLAKWKSRLLCFLQLLLFKRHGRLVLKSPQHTFRLKVLNDMFPRAKFIHIVRDPYVVYPSTVHFWKTMYETYGLQGFDFGALREYVFSTFEQMHAKLEATRTLIAAGQLYELRYEDLSSDPVVQMEALYEFLELGDFDVVRPAVERYAERSKRYRTNHYSLDAPTSDEIARRWGAYFEKYGYETNQIID